MNKHNRRRRLNQLLLVICCLFLGGNLAETHAEQFYIVGSADTDTVHFESDASLEFIGGFTHNIKGVISFNPDSAKGQSEGFLRVEAADLKTGIELRDQHMRENHLHTDKYPYIEFTLKSVTGLPDALPPDSPVSCLIEGEFQVHGVTRPISAPAEVLLVEKDPIRGERVLLVSAEFHILLDDYSIPRPKALFLKLAEQINIRIHFIASSLYPPVKF